MKMVITSNAVYIGNFQWTSLYMDPIAFSKILKLKTYITTWSGSHPKDPTYFMTAPSDMLKPL